MKSLSSRPVGATPTIAIVGGGVIGLGIGWRLAQAGAKVDVFERGTAGRGASWAAGGMLAAGIEAEPGEEELTRLNRASQGMWHAFTRELETATGADLGYRGEGTLVIATTADEVSELRHQFEIQRGMGIELAWLDGRAVLAKEPYLSPRTLAAISSPHDHQVDNRRLAVALKDAFLAAGGKLHENAPVAAVDVGGARARGLWLGERHHPADVVVIAAGAWSRTIGGLPDQARPPVRPIKGQLLALRMDSAAPLLSHVVWVPKAYLVPRGDGRLIIGATVEERGFDDTITAGGMLSLLDAAWRALPGIEELAIEETWSGVRPTSRDDAPILGPSGTDGLVLATGHHRNGILLTPLTIDTISRHILTGEVDPAIRPFGIERFGRGPAAKGARESAAVATP
ncbi:MAG: glycine oxidase ThiO [Alphaproteobacteria bacterium]